MSVPELSPLVAGNLVCHECGKPMKMEVVMGRKGQKQVVSHLKYTCINKQTGCRYTLNSTGMTNGEMVALREDGSEVRIGE
jgi:hypothetical protein